MRPDKKKIAHYIRYNDLGPIRDQSDPLSKDIIDVLDTLELRQKVLMKFFNSDEFGYDRIRWGKILKKLQDKILDKFLKAIGTWKQFHEWQVDLNPSNIEYVAEDMLHKEFKYSNNFAIPALDSACKAQVVSKVEKKFQNFDKILQVEQYIKKAQSVNGDINDHIRAFEIALNATHNNGPLLQYFAATKRHMALNECADRIKDYLDWLSNMKDEELEFTPKELEMLSR